MNQIVEFCFMPECHYRYGDPGPHWIMDPLGAFAEEEYRPHLYCPACGKPRWLAVTEEEFKSRFVLDVSPRGTYIEPAGHFVSDGFRSQASDVDIYLIDGAGNPAAWLWDIRVRGEMSIREQYNLELPDACTYGPLTPCEAMVCVVCGAMPKSPGEQLTVVMTHLGPVWVCRHGHFQGTSIHAFVGLPVEMTGPKMLEVLEWVPELVVEKWKHLWWGAPDINMREYRRLRCQG